MLQLKNKVVVITGAANGIGLSITKKFLENGSTSAIIVDIDEEKGSEVAAKLNKEYGEYKTRFFKCDITKNIDVADEIIKQYRSVDVLVNSAGLGIITDHKKLIETNVTATIGWTYKFYDHMRIDKGGKGGTIINLASIYGFRINRYFPTYQASKFAVMGFTRSLGHMKNFEETGIRVIAICPGSTRTTMNEKVKKEIKNNIILPTDYIESMRGKNIQEPDVVGAATVEVFKNADSGTAWLIEHGKPVEDSIQCYIKSHNYNVPNKTPKFEF